MITAFKIFGERHTGTNVIQQFISLNFNLEAKYYEYLGWKHRLAPDDLELKKHNIDNTLFIFTFRSPYSWLKAMHREPYYSHFPGMTQLSFDEFITFQIEDYENSISMWNKKNKSYLELSRKVPKALIITLEEFRLNQSKIFQSLNSILETDIQEMKSITSYINGRGILKERDIDENIFMDNLSPRNLDTINSLLDFNIMAELGYSKMEQI